MAVARVRMFDRHGDALGELEGTVGPVSWRLNRVGKATLAVAKTDPKATATMLHLYNRVLIEFDNGLPDWGGVVIPPRQWTKDWIELTVLDGGERLHYRMTDHGRYFDGTVAGAISQRLIEEANAIAETGIVIDSVWAGGAARYKDYHYDDLLNAIEVLTEQTGYDFAIRPVFEGGTLTWKASWYEERGEDRPNVVLIEGHNCMVAAFEEQGPVINRWAGVGEGATWTEKLKTELADTDSQNLYGLLESAQVFPGVVNLNTLEENVAALLAASKAPSPRLELQAMNVAPAAFAAYDVGDRVRVQLHNYGFLGGRLGYDHAMRVLAREFDPGSGLCTLVVEESEFS